MDNDEHSGEQDQELSPRAAKILERIEEREQKRKQSDDGSQEEIDADDQDDEGSPPVKLDFTDSS